MTAADARVDAAWIASHIDDPLVRVIEIDVSPAAYNAGHIPGASLWNAYADLRHADYLPISAAELQALLRRSGVTAATTIVFYGYGALLGYWLMSSYGHAGPRFMDGPREQWVTAGRDWSTGVAAPVESAYVLTRQPTFHSSQEDILQMMGQPGRLLLDTRSRAEYEGERFWPSGAAAGAGRAGHVPGAVHLPIEWLRTDNGRFRSGDEMRQVLADHGIARGSEIVTYCTIGNRAAQAWYALTHLLEYDNVRVYYGSWTEWGLSATTPIETSVSRGAAVVTRCSTTGAA
jgi:thiosulfate/3-mercaptopyruvate sulfurtransferase